jgi:hypothetical protein
MGHHLFFRRRLGRSSKQPTEQHIFSENCQIESGLIQPTPSAASSNDGVFNDAGEPFGAGTSMALYHIQIDVLP